MRGFLVMVGLVIGLLGWVGASALDGPEAAGYIGGAITLGGAFVICALFSYHARWHGIGGAGVVALLGAGRNAPALLEVARGLASPPVWCRLAIAALCAVVVVMVGRAFLVMRRSRG